MGSWVFVHTCELNYFEAESEARVQSFQLPFSLQARGSCPLQGWNPNAPQPSKNNHPRTPPQLFRDPMDHEKRVLMAQ